MEQMTPTDTATNDSSAQDGTEPDAQGIDAIIAKVDGYIADPKSVTPETLQELKMDLEDLKSILEPQEDQQAAPAGPPAGGLAAMIGGAK